MPKPGEPHLAVRAVHQNIGWLDVLVDQTALVNLAERCGDADRKAQEASHLYGRAEPPVEWLQTVNILEHQHGVTGVVHELQRPQRPRGVQVVLQSVLVSKPIEARARRVRSAQAERSKQRSACHQHRCATLGRRHARHPPTKPDNHYPDRRRQNGAEICACCRQLRWAGSRGRSTY